MRIGIDARPLTQPTTGIGRYTFEIISRFKRADLELFLYAHQPVDPPAAISARVRHADLSANALASPFAQYRFPRWAHIDEVDVFWSPRHHLPLFSSAPSVVTIHDLVWRHAPDSMIPLGRTIEALLMPPSLRKANAIIAVSEATRQDLLNFQPNTAKRTHVIPEAPFSRISAHEGTPARGDFMLFVGTFEPRKNIPGILRAYAALRAGGITSHRLVLAGNPGWKSDVPGLIAELDLVDKVTIAGPLPQSELETLYRACDFVVQPSYYEGFGLPVVEALAFRKPVITSNLSAMPEVAGDAGLLVDPESVPAISDAMKRLITDDSLYMELADKALEQAAKFSWDQAAADTLKVLESVAALENSM